MAGQVPDWYAAMFANSGTWQSALKNQFDAIGQPAPKPVAKPIQAKDIVFNATSLGLGASIAQTGGPANTPATVTLPNGDVIKSTGNIATDFLNGILGTSPLAAPGAYETPEGEEYAGTSGFGPGGFDLGPLIARGAIIIAGFIFVAAGLSMFKPGMTIVQSVNKVAMGGVG